MPKDKLLRIINDDDDGDNNDNNNDEFYLTSMLRDPSKTCFLNKKC